MKGGWVDILQVSHYFIRYLAVKNPPMALQYQESVHPIKPDVHKMDKHTFKILQKILQDLQRVFDHFMDTNRF